MKGISFHNSKNMQLSFANRGDEKAWLRSEADRGDVESQHRLGLLLMEETTDANALREAYKWLFISVWLGHSKAHPDLIKIMLTLDIDGTEDSYELVDEWYAQKFDDSRGEDQQTWSLELLRMRFGDTLLN
jgi:TPR repeat protein